MKLTYILISFLLFTSNLYAEDGFYRIGYDAVTPVTGFAVSKKFKTDLSVKLIIGEQKNEPSIAVRGMSTFGMSNTYGWAGLGNNYEILVGGAGIGYQANFSKRVEFHLEAGLGLLLKIHEDDDDEDPFGTISKVAESLFQFGIGLSYRI